MSETETERKRDSGSTCIHNCANVCAYRVCTKMYPQPPKFAVSPGLSGFRSRVQVFGCRFEVWV